LYEKLNILFDLSIGNRKLYCFVLLAYDMIRKLNKVAPGLHGPEFAGAKIILGELGTGSGTQTSSSLQMAERSSQNWI
jgi:hypothetical protein